MRVVCLIAAAGLLAGCDGGRAGKKKGSGRPSVAEEMIDGATGRTAVRHGKRAMETVKRVSKQEQEDLNEVLE